MYVMVVQYEPGANLLLIGGARVGTLPPDAGVIPARGCCEKAMPEELNIRMRQCNT